MFSKQNLRLTSEKIYQTHPFFQQRWVGRKRQKTLDSTQKPDCIYLEDLLEHLIWAQHHEAQISGLFFFPPQSFKTKLWWNINDNRFPIILIFILCACLCLCMSMCMRVNVTVESRRGHWNSESYSYRLLSGIGAGNLTGVLLKSKNALFIAEALILQE